MALLAFKLPAEDVRLLEYKNTIYKIKLKYVSKDAFLPCSQRELNKQVEQVLRTLLHAQFFSEMSLTTDHFNVKCQAYTWDALQFIDFVRDNTTLKTHPLVFSLIFQPRQIGQASEKQNKNLHETDLSHLESHPSNKGNAVSDNEDVTCVRDSKNIKELSHSSEKICSTIGPVSVPNPDQIVETKSQNQSQISRMSHVICFENLDEVGPNDQFRSLHILSSDRPPDRAQERSDTLKDHSRDIHSQSIENDSNIKTIAINKEIETSGTLGLQKLPLNTTTEVPAKVPKNQIPPKKRQICQMEPLDIIQMSPKFLRVDLGRKMSEEELLHLRGLLGQEGGSGDSNTRHERSERFVSPGVRGDNRDPSDQIKTKLQPTLRSPYAASIIEYQAQGNNTVQETKINPDEGPRIVPTRGTGKGKVLMKSQESTPSANSKSSPRNAKYTVSPLDEKKHRMAHKRSPFRKKYRRRRSSSFGIALEGFLESFC